MLESDAAKQLEEILERVEDSVSLDTENKKEIEEDDATEVAELLDTAITELQGLRDRIWAPFDESELTPEQIKERRLLKRNNALAALKELQAEEEEA